MEWRTSFNEFAADCLNFIVEQLEHAADPRERAAAIDAAAGAIQPMKRRYGENEQFANMMHLLLDEYIDDAHRQRNWHDLVVSA